VRVSRGPPAPHNLATRPPQCAETAHCQPAWAPAVQNATQVDRCRLGGWDGGVSPPSCSGPRIIAATATTAGNDRFISATPAQPAANSLLMTPGPDRKFRQRQQYPVILSECGGWA